MFGGLGMWEVLLIFLVALLLFGAKRLPEIGSSLGKGIREFKSSIRELESEINVPEDRRVDSGRRYDQPSSSPGEKEPQEDGEPRSLSERS